MSVSGKWKKIGAWSWLLVLAAALYAAYTVYSRRQATRAIERDAARRRTEADRRIVEQLGGGELKIVSFYASPASVAPGGRALLCYGVANASAVRIEPTIEPIQPSLSRCLQVRPASSTTYTLTAADAEGRELRQSVELRVQK